MECTVHGFTRNFFNEPLLITEMKTVRYEKGAPTKANGRLVEIKLLFNSAYYFIYESGNVFRLTKLDLKAEETELTVIPCPSKP
jgi:hypothetical protein